MSSKKIWWLLICGVVLTGMLAAGIYMYSGAGDSDSVCVSLNGERMITLRYGEQYTDAGASAVIVDGKTGEESETEVSVSGAVDPDTVGTYTIRYTAADGRKVGTAYRRVRVVDTDQPMIELVSDPAHYTLPGSPYEEEGFSAFDAYDGDLTDHVFRMVTKDKVIYIVSDSSGNRTSVTRDIVYYDPIPPELNLEGDSFVVLNVGDAYVEPGYTAVDNCAGDLAGYVQIAGNVDTTVAGKYILTYSATDDFNNTTSVNRTVFVKAPEIAQVNNPAAGNKFIYLTFDDGPGADTPYLLDILKKYNVPASFFVVNTNYISTIARAAQEGHTVAIHTATHKFSQVYASEDAFFADLYQMQEIIKYHTGNVTTLMRFPGGSSNTVSSFNEGIMTRLTQLVEEKGFVYFDWNVDSNDAGGARTAKQVYKNVVKGIGDKENAVVLMHDIKSYTIEAIEQIIVWGLENGYTFRALDTSSPTCHHGVNN